ncbi:hypothetical protein RHMOL_Rhmol10G0276500 [Rhododendron molle]|uniref:Uncharacterized protein n=1 Tax=Rhododendron molle TaxID=49168 RepID=A0ACC0M7Y7_RHOML|nr:hypothetical protein RHMOL_Rhmol10G0276500 [Rhododendron molle]
MSNSFGGYLGLTNFTTDGKVLNQIIAIELKTFKEDYDPNSNPIGLNINSVISNTTTSLTPLGFELVPPYGTHNFFNVWVQYDGIEKVINQWNFTPIIAISTGGDPSIIILKFSSGQQNMHKQFIAVYMAQQNALEDPTPPRPETPILKSYLDLRGVVNQNSYFGFSTSTANSAEFNRVLWWNLTVEYYHDEKCMKIGLIVGIPTVLVLLPALVGLVYYIRRRWLWQRTDRQMSGEVKCMPGMPREYQYKELQKATNNFEETRKLGILRRRGSWDKVGYGVVYKQNLCDAPKWYGSIILPRITYHRTGNLYHSRRQHLPLYKPFPVYKGYLANQKDLDDFFQELTIINQLRHKHLVPLESQKIVHSFIRKSNSAMAYIWNFGFSSSRPAKRKFEMINCEY